MQKLAAAKQLLVDAEQQPLPRIVLISVDPERDTPELMAQYVDYFGDNNVGVTGALEQAFPCPPGAPNLICVASTRMGWCQV